MIFFRWIFFILIHRSHFYSALINEATSPQIMVISETSGQVPLPWNQCLIKRDRHRHVTRKGMDNYRWSIGHIKVRPDR